MKNDKLNKESLRNHLLEMVLRALDEETQNLTLELAIERQKAIDALVEENRAVIKEVLEDSKNRIYSNPTEMSPTDACPTNYVNDLIEQLYKMLDVSVASTSPDIPASEPKTDSMKASALIQLEILPTPRPGGNTLN